MFWVLNQRVYCTFVCVFVFTNRHMQSLYTSLKKKKGWITTEKVTFDKHFICNNFDFLTFFFFLTWPIVQGTGLPRGLGISCKDSLNGAVTILLICFIDLLQPQLSKKVKFLWLEVIKVGWAYWVFSFLLLMNFILTCLLLQNTNNIVHSPIIHFSLKAR